MTRRDLIVDGAAARLRLDRVLAKLVPELSQKAARKLIEAGGLFVDGRRQRSAAARAKVGARLVLHTVPIQADDAPLVVLFEDERICVIDKQPGLHMNETETSGRVSVIERIQALVPEARVVHRLDKDTSGVVVLAKDRKTAEQLSFAFREREVDKRYLALCEGAPPAGRIDAAIGPDARRPRARRVRQDGKPAVSVVTPLAVVDGVAAVLVTPKTGRTHQIRLHLAYVGCPILGDRLYGGPSAVRIGGEVRRIPRLMLHAAALTFELDGLERTFEAPIPADIAGFAGYGLALDASVA